MELCHHDELTRLRGYLLPPLSMSKPVDEWAVITLTDGGSREIVFLRPLLVVPGILGPTMDDVYLIISVSGGRRTPPRILAGSLKWMKTKH